MDTIEFLRRTDHRNLMHNLGFMVKQRLREYDRDLEHRRQQLKEIFHFEDCQYAEELALLMLERIEEQKLQREELEKTRRLEQERAEEQLLKLKQLQRELENCEAWREQQTREILFETKRAQLFQIEVKKVLKERDQRVELMWLQAMARLNEEKGKQEEYEQHLRKAIADKDQAWNVEIVKQQKRQAQQAQKALREEMAAEHSRALKLEQQSQLEEKHREQCKKIMQGGMLKAQIEQNMEKLKLEKCLQEAESTREELQEKQLILNELNWQAKQKISNRAWHQKYLEYASNEQKEKAARDHALDGMLSGTGCVLQQKNKRPYGKQNR